MVLLGAANVEKNGSEALDGVNVAPKHEVGEAHIVIQGDLAGGNARVETLLAEIDGIKHLQGEPVVAEQALHAQHAHNAKVAEQAEHGVAAKVIRAKRA